MARVAPINLTYNPRMLWFDPGDLDIRKGDAVVVETARGVEFGRAASDVIEVSRSEIKALKSPLKPVKRLADEDDVERAREMEERGRAALPVFKEMAADAGIDMHPVSVEFLLDGDKAVFYFDAEERVDFRDLVRKLAARFHVRIDMRQIGVRDEARIVGGIGHCGQELCCKRLGGDFNPVSIRMAKEQDLSLNPQKISGLCGRLMCCLRYEYDAYKEFKSRAPKANATIQTPQGPAKVVDIDVPRETISLRVDDEKPVRVPLSAFDAPKEGSNRPSSIGEEAWEEACSQMTSGYRGEAAVFSTSQFTGSDKLAEAGTVKHSPSSKRRRSSEEDAEERGSSRSRGKGSRGQGKSRRSSKATDGERDSRKARRRRSTKITAGERASEETAEHRRDAASGKGGADGRDGAKPARRSRNRSHTAGSSRDGRGEQAQGSRQDKRSQRSRDAEGKAGASRGGSSAGSQGKRAPRGQRQGDRPRPGQRSSGLARRDGERAHPPSEGGQGADKPSNGHRRPRRRNRKERTDEAPQGGSE